MDKTKNENALRITNKLKRKMIKLKKEYRSIEKGIDKIEMFLDYHQSPVDSDNAHSPYYEDVMFETFSLSLEESDTENCPSVGNTSKSLSPQKPKNRKNSFKKQTLFEQEELKQEDTKFKLRQILTEIIRIENDFLGVYETIEFWLERFLPDVLTEVNKEEEEANNYSGNVTTPSNGSNTTSPASASTSTSFPTINVVRSEKKIKNSTSFSGNSSKDLETSATRRKRVIEIFNKGLFQGKKIHHYLNINAHIDKIINFWDIFQDVFNLIQDSDDMLVFDGFAQPTQVTGKAGKITKTNAALAQARGMIGLKNQKYQQDQHFCCDWEELSKTCSSHVTSFEAIIADFNCLIKS